MKPNDNLIVSSTEPTGNNRKKVWMQDADKKIYVKNDNDVYEEFIKAEESCVLYESSSGSSETIILSDNISNYKYLEIYFCNNSLNNLHSTKITSLEGKSTALFFDNVYIDSDNTVVLEIRIKLVKINNNSITTIRESFNEIKGIAISSNKEPNTNNQKIFIYKVVGYK